jgi:peroxiredoxin
MQRRYQALLLLALGILAGGTAIVLAWREQEQTVAPPAALVVEAGVYPVASLFGVDNNAAQPDAGHPAPDFVIHLPDGSTTSLAAYRGRPVVINFWATWCPPCRLEMPELIRAFERYHDQGLVVLAINDAEAHEQVAAFVREFGLTMPVIIDPRGEVMQAYKTNALPSTFFIDRRGVVRVRWIGVLTPDVLEQHLRTIL